MSKEILLEVYIRGAKRGLIGVGSEDDAVLMVQRITSFGMYVEEKSGMRFYPPSAVSSIGVSSKLANVLDAADPSSPMVFFESRHQVPEDIQ